MRFTLIKGKTAPPHDNGSGSSATRFTCAQSPRSTEISSPAVPARYLAKLMVALAQDVVAPSLDERLPEPVRERELEVLALIAAGKSNAEIARELFVSVSTVKTHINNLYRKLDARNRTQTVARARELGVL